MADIGFNIFLVYVISWTLHLTARIPVLGVIRFDLMLVGTLFLISFFVPNEIRNNGEEPNKTEKILKILIIYMVISLPFVEWPGSVIRTGFIEFLKAFVFFFFVKAFIDSEKKLRLFLLVFLACQTFRILEPLYLHVTQGYWGSVAFMSGDFLNRLSGGPFDIVNPNGLAFIIVSTLPFFHFYSRISTLHKGLYFLIPPLFIYALILTASRSGLVALAVSLMGIFIKSRHKVLIAFLVIISAVVLFPRLSPELQDRYTSIISSDTKSSATAQGRIEGTLDALKVAMRKPVFGHGLGTSLEANVNFNANMQITHNLYAELFQEIGVVGCVIFILLIKSIIENFVTSLKRLKEKENVSLFMVSTINAMQVWLGMNLFFSFFSYGLSTYQWYLFAGLSVCTSKIVAHQTPSKSLVQGY